MTWTWSLFCLQMSSHRDSTGPCLTNKARNLKLWQNIPLSKHAASNCITEVFTIKWLIKLLSMCNYCLGHALSALIYYIITMTSKNDFGYENIFLYLPPLVGVWKIVGTHYNPINYNHCTGVFDSMHEASGCIDHNAKNLASLHYTVAEKIKKTPRKLPLF